MSTIITDRLSLTDNKSKNINMPKMQSHGLWAKTEIMCSYDDIEYDKNGISYFAKKIPTGISKLGETIFRTEKVEPLFTTSNMVPIGGCQFAMEMLYGVKNSELIIPTLYDELKIGLANSNGTNAKYDTPNGQVNATYEYGNFVQLFGIGITGTAENDVTVHNVDYREKSIEMSKIAADGQQLEGKMIPFRHTSGMLSENEKKQYFGKKTQQDDVVSYYLKKFESAPVIKHIYRTGEDTETETELTKEQLWSNNNIGQNAIESFTEVQLKITKEDVKEWFIAQGQEDRTRINTIALFTGQYVKNADGSIGDYRDVRMFSKLNIKPEYLSLTKDLTLIYRVYTA